MLFLVYLGPIILPAAGAVLGVLATRFFRGEPSDAADRLLVAMWIAGGLAVVGGCSVWVGRSHTMVEWFGALATYSWAWFGCAFGIGAVFGWASVNKED